MLRGPLLHRTLKVFLKNVPVDAGVQLKKRYCVNNTASILMLDTNQLELFSEFHCVDVILFLWHLMRLTTNIVNYAFRQDVDLALKASHTPTVQRRL